MLSFREYIQFLEIATDSWLTAPVQPVAGLIRHYKGPIPGNLDLSNKPPTSKKSDIDPEILDIIHRIKNRRPDKISGLSLPKRKKLN